MTRKVYRTANGKMIDLGALQLRNETVRAVGNMNVNARGDLVDSNNRPIATKNQQVASQYRKQTNVSDVSVHAKPAPAVEIPAPPEDFEDDFVKDLDKSDTTSQAPATGLAAAIAKSRQIKP